MEPNFDIAGSIELEKRILIVKDSLGESGSGRDPTSSPDRWLHLTIY